MNILQYDLFADNSHLGLLKQENNEIRQSLMNLRKGIFSRHSALEKELISMKEELDRLRGMVVETKVS